MSVVVNAAYDPQRVPASNTEALAFHHSLPGYEPTPVHELPWLAAETGVASVLLKDESARLGLPAFKVLGASWAVEQTLAERPDVHTLVAASSGNHGRAVAHLAATRGLASRIFLPRGSRPGRIAAIESEGAEVVVVDGPYEEAVAEAAAAAADPRVAEIADVGSSPQSAWVVDGYVTLFSEAAAQADFDVLLVPVGVGSLAAAAVRFAAARGVHVIGVEPATAACLTASLAAGRPTAVPTPGTTMAGLNCAEVSPAAWPALEAGISGMLTVGDAETHEAMRELARAGLAIGDSGASSVAALRRLARDEAAADLRKAIGFGAASRALLLATEGPTDPDAYRATVGAP